MQEINRILVDVTDTYSSDLVTGIQRVVRNLAAHLPDIDPRVRLVCFHGDGMHIVSTLPPAPAPSRQVLARSYGHQVAQASRRWVGAVAGTTPLSRWITATRNEPGFARIWYEAKGRMRRRQSSNAAFELGRGDLVAILDSSWSRKTALKLQTGKTRGYRVVANIYDLIPLRTPHFVDDAHFHAFYPYIECLARFADGFTCISEAVANDIRNQWPLLAPGRALPPIKPFQLGADFRSGVQTPVPEIVPDSLPGDSQLPIVLMVGTIEPRKNHLLALRACSALWQLGRSFRLIIVGKTGWKVDALLRQMREHPEWGRRLFHQTRVDDPTLQALYAHARCLLFPSFEEGFGLPIVEALHHRLPVIASDLAVHREVGGEDAHYFSLNQPEGLVALLQKALSAGLEQPSGRNVPTWKQSAASYITALERVART